MPGLVAQFPVAPFTTPVNGDDLDAALVVSHDSSIASAHTLHDADPTIHFQSSTLAARPGAGIVGRKWITTDGRRVYYDTGAAWSEIDYLCQTAGGTVAGATTFTGVTTVPGDSNLFQVKSTGGAAYLQLFGAAASGHINWQIAKSVTIANALQFIPSTVADGSVFTTPAATLSNSGALTLAGALSATTGAFSGAVSMTALTATTGAFSGAVSMAGLTATTGGFSGAVSTGALTVVGGFLNTGIPVARFETTGGGPLAGATGIGTELYKFGIQTFNRTTVAYSAMNIDAADILLNANGGSGRVLMGTSVTTGSVAGDAVLANAKFFRGLNVAATTARQLVGMSSGDFVVVGDAAANGTFLNGIALVGTTVTTGAVAGDLVLQNVRSLRGVNAAGTASKHLISINASDTVYVGFDIPGAIALGAPVSVVSAAAGEVVVANNKSIRASNAAGTGTYALIYLDNTDKVQIDANGRGATFSGTISVPSANKVFLDGGGDTYVWEGAANTIQMFAGGVAGIILTAANLNISNVSLTAAAIAMGGALSGVTTLSMAGALSGATTIGASSSVDVGVGHIKAGTTTAVTAVGATTIYTAVNAQGFAIVHGSSAGKIFCDLITWDTSIPTVAVLAGNVLAGVPGARTYTMSGSNVQLQMSATGNSVKVVPIELN